MQNFLQLNIDTVSLGSPEKSLVTEATRNHALLQIPIHSIQHANAAQVVELQKILLHGDTLGKWVTPDAWIPPSQKRPAVLKVDINRRVIHFLPPHLKRLPSDEGAANYPENQPIIKCIKEAVLVITRYLILLRIGPVGRGKRAAHCSLDPSMIMNIAYNAGPMMLALAIASTFDSKGKQVSDGISFNLLRTKDLALLSEGYKRRVRAEFQRMNELVVRGLWIDAPNFQGESSALAMSGSPRYTEIPKKVESHLPLPDEYVSEMGSRSLWLMRVLGPNLLEIGKKITALYLTPNKRGEFGRETNDGSGRKIRQLVSTYRWMDQDGEEFDAPPFSLLLPKPCGFAIPINSSDAQTNVSWPPKNYRDVLALSGVVQMAHYFIVSISMGARQSEVLSLRRDCVLRAADGKSYANGKTYKLVQRHEGELRDWQLPDAAVEAIARQTLLVETAERIAFLRGVRTKDSADPDKGTHLWAQLSGAAWSDETKQLNNINTGLRFFANSLSLSTEPGGQSLRSHRFRKTLARLVALALTQAPKLLMDVFGHKSIEMTLYYILSDPNLRVEIDTVARELRVMRAKEVIQRMVEADLASNSKESLSFGGYGGLAAISLHNAITVNRERVHRQGSSWGANDVQQLAELLTLQGKAWEQVRSGILCTKFPGETGPCSKSKGRPEPSKCQSTCAHRLEEAFLREDVDNSIRESLAAYDAAISNDESLTASHWAAQICNHIPRFPDLQEKWMKNETVHQLLRNKQDKAAE